MAQGRGVRGEVPSFANGTSKRSKAMASIASFCKRSKQTEQGDGKHRLYGGGIRKASFLMPA